MKEDKYNNLLNELNDLNERINDLLINVTELRDITRKAVSNMRSNCNHIWFTSAYGHAEDEKEFYTHRTCVKCLAERLVYGNFQVNEKYKDESGIETSIVNDKDYVLAVYNNIIAKNPGIDDETAAKYLEIAIEKIASIKEEDKINGVARRLKINPNNIDRYIGYGE